ncbi:hypothetical protein B0H67DRAFT_638068 [Lasiosphaeris hirsuta]|uniref:Uncharacterized protein n=1 Tax=Lasiosphaeris hirsuta TaxID=260670 RepID=A0AA40B866_9PEZI|nr:hypothetical protein B0H67DRAFT_638068 [Lasiosphaeris hirsuta]
MRPDEDDPYLRIRNPKVATSRRGRPKNTPTALPSDLTVPSAPPSTPRAPKRATPKSAKAANKAKKTTPKPTKANAPRPLQQSVWRRLSAFELLSSDDEAIRSTRSGGKEAPIQISEDEDMEEGT